MYAYFFFTTQKNILMMVQGTITHIQKDDKT